MDRGMLFSRRIQSPIPYLENHVLAYAKFDWSEFRFDIVLRIMKIAHGRKYHSEIENRLENMFNY